MSHLTYFFPFFFGDNFIKIVVKTALTIDGLSCTVTPIYLNYKSHIVLQYQHISKNPSPKNYQLCSVYWNISCTCFFSFFLNIFFSAFFVDFFLFFTFLGPLYFICLQDLFMSLKLNERFGKSHH